MEDKKAQEKMIKVPQIIVEREKSEKEWTLSHYFINSFPKGVGVEDEERAVKVFGETRIDNGIYEVDFTYSERFSKGFFVDANGFISRTKTERFNKEHLVMLVKNVPKFDGIRWHWGCTDLDTHGCYCVGSYFGNLEVIVKGKKEMRKGVVSSRINYIEKFYPAAFNLWLNNKRNNLKTYVEYKDRA